MVITSRKNDAVKRFRELLREKSVRDAQGVFAVEGDHLCGELAKGGFRILTALMTENAAVKYPKTAAALGSAGEVVVISQEIAEYISDTKAPQGLFAIAEKPHSDGIPDGAGRLVLLDGVQDPGNVGTILRTAEALGFDGAALSPECADIWSPKTLRASMGSVFRLPCITGELPGIISGLKEMGFRVYGSMLDSSAAKLGELEFPERAAVVIGSEGAGISGATAKACDQAVYIPISGAESLNAGAAAAILLWELSKR
ncbi:MAG TPA: RNA methyltransferase [Ruminococcaceae bacterium]|nr:RNA methyltransferase [Oscillospiraceae bacterium]